MMHGQKNIKINILVWLWIILLSCTFC